GFAADRGWHHREQRSAWSVRREGGWRRLARCVPAGADQRHCRCDRRSLQRLAGNARPRFRGPGEAPARGQQPLLMDPLPEFQLVRPATLDEVLAARARHPESRVLGGGTDLVVNIRRGIVAPPVLIEINQVAELRAIKANAHTLEIGAAVTLAELAAHA